MSSLYERQRMAWSNPPVDGVGYLSAAKLSELPADDLVALIERMEHERYNGWRNENGRWRSMLGLDTTHGKDVLDYGTGTGIEALQYARAGNRVSVADIAPENVALAQRVLRAFGYRAEEGHVLAEDYPRALLVPCSFDVVHAAGVLHHIEDVDDVVAEIAEWLRPGGELRVMLYSDVSWQRATNTPPPTNIREHTCFQQYVAAMDAVGEYADWYDCTKIERRWGGWFDVIDCGYLDGTLGYIGAVLRGG